MTPVRHCLQLVTDSLREDLETISRLRHLVVEAVDLGGATQEDVDDLRRMGEGLAKILGEDPRNEGDHG